MSLSWGWTEYWIVEWRRRELMKLEALLADFLSTIILFISNPLQLFCYVISKCELNRQIQTI